MKEPRYCVRCKRWIKGLSLDVTDIDDWFRSRQPPVFSAGKYEVFTETPRHCSVCGKVFRKFIRLDGRLWCRECIWNQLEETDPGPNVY